MLLSVEQEGALVENGILGFTARAIEYELGEFLAAQKGCMGRTAFMLADALIWMTSSLGADERWFEFGSTGRAIFASLPLDFRHTFLLMTMPIYFWWRSMRGTQKGPTGHWRKTVGVPNWFVWLRR